MRRRLPQAHWWLLAVVLVALMAALGLQDLSTGLGASETLSTVQTPAYVDDGGPLVLRDEKGSLTSRKLPRRTAIHLELSWV